MSLFAKPVQRKSLHAQTYEILREQILSGEFLPGDRLVETHLAERLQVSRTPIREAIRQLQQEGLIAADANGWLRVATVSVAEAIDLYDCRMALETLSVTGACTSASDADLGGLQTCVHQAEQLSQLPGAADSVQLLDLDCQFHRLIAQSSGNQYLVSLLDHVFTKMALLRACTTRRNPSVLDIRSEHQQIYQAITQRDTATAVTAIQTHLEASKLRVIRELEQ